MTIFGILAGHYDAENIAYFLKLNEEWKNLSLISMTRNYREINGTLSIQEKYYISDLKLSSEDFAKFTRGHWSIENNLHWILDVHFRKD